MASQGANLFSLTDHSSNSWSRADAFISGSYSLATSTRRGIDLSAAIDVTAELQGSVGADAKVSGAIDGSLGVGVQLEAAFPVDLFQQFGLATRLRAAAEVAVYVNASVSASLDDLRNLLGVKMSGAWGQLAESFLSGVDISAGVWAKVAFAAEAVAEAVIAGSLLPTTSGPPGLTVSIHYGAGFGY